jgi:hypothetical protein
VGLVEEERAHRRGDPEQDQGDEDGDRPDDHLPHDALEAHVHQREVRERQAPLEVAADRQDPPVGEHGGVAAAEVRFGDDALAGGEPRRGRRSEQPRRQAAKGGSGPARHCSRLSLHPCSPQTTIGVAAPSIATIAPVM